MVLSSAGKRLAALLPKQPAQNISKIPTPIKSAIDKTLSIPFLSMSNKAIHTTIGTNNTGFFIGEGECRIQFNEEQMDALHMAQTHSQALADAFVNYCKMTFSSGEIPTCFRQDLGPETFDEIHEDLETFQKNFSAALFRQMLIFEH